MSKSNSLFSLLMAATLASCAVEPVSAPISDAPLTLTLGTATPGGGFPVYGTAFAETVHEADPAITIETRNTTGSAENIPLLEASRLGPGHRDRSGIPLPLSGPR